MPASIFAPTPTTSGQGTARWSRGVPVPSAAADPTASRHAQLRAKMATSHDHVAVKRMLRDLFDQAEPLETAA